MPKIYRALWQNVLFPLQNAVRGRQAIARYRFLNRSQWWSREQIEEFQWKECQRLLEVALTRVPYYRRKLPGVAAQDIRNWEDFRKLPILTRGDVEEHREDLRDQDLPQNGYHLHATGGSSGRPVRFYRTAESYDWRVAAKRRTYSWCGCEYGDRLLFLWGAPVGKPRRLAVWKQDTMDRLNRNQSIPTFAQSEAVWREVHLKLQRWRPEYLGGYVSSLMNFGRFAEAEGLRLPPLRAIVAAAEPLEEAQRMFLAATYGAPVFNTYGSREFMSIGGECDRHRGFHVAAENLVVETAGAGGEPSDILITDLHNHGTVFLRYAIGDYGVVSSKACPCGRGLPVLESVLGRTADTITLPGGRTISGIFFRHVLKDIPELVEFQVTQPRPDHVVVSAVLASPLSEQSRALFDSEMRRILQANSFELRPTESVTLSQSGKKRTIIPYAQTDTPQQLPGKVES